MTAIKSLKKLFKNEELLSLALTHKSWVNEHPGERRSNERLEFLGDAIIEFVVSQHLYKKFPQKEEGYLTALRANLVNTVNLSEIAKNLKLGRAIYLSKGEEDGGGRTNPSLLADTVEAVVGALFLDSGLDSAKKLIEQYILVVLPEKVAQPLKDAKSRLQEVIQAQGTPAPKYIVVEETGPDHNKKFILDVVINGKTAGQGEGKNKSQAQQKAAEDALSRLVKEKESGRI